MMRKSIFAALLVLIMLLGGCSDVSTAPTRNDESELVTETEAAAKAESTKSIYSSESNESKVPEAVAALETAAEVTEREPVQSETVRQTEPVKQSEAETPATKPTTENNNPPPAETPTQTASENTKTAYDFEFDMEAIKADCISIPLRVTLATLAGRSNTLSAAALSTDMVFLPTKKGQKKNRGFSFLCLLFCLT